MLKLKGRVDPQVEFLLFECLQDLTGGGPAFYLASYSLMVDITNTSPQTRTRRLSILDSFIPIGFLTGFMSHAMQNRGLIRIRMFKECFWIQRTHFFGILCFVFFTDLKKNNNSQLDIISRTTIRSKRFVHYENFVWLVPS